ncbi:hypothetical protein NPX13_g6475 [Xylaria arbuscula]|uniref:Uncharacterized protein n=1 Tax=Xylaria arbuscula TaxID=114810 RepID=A0A9W8NC52_9PEZI|nr:hypothetical protein NPX13_g6475 [Xylaria arbuscula]
MRNLFRRASCVLAGEESVGCGGRFTDGGGRGNQMTNLEYNGGRKVMEAVGNTSMHRAVGRKWQSLVGLIIVNRGRSMETRIDKEEWTGTGRRCWVDEDGNGDGDGDCGGRGALLLAGVLAVMCWSSDPANGQMTTDGDCSGDASAPPETRREQPVESCLGEYPDIDRGADISITADKRL